MEKIAKNLLQDTTQTDAPTDCLTNIDKQGRKENPTLKQMRNPNIYRLIPRGAEDHEGPKTVAPQHTKVRGRTSPQVDREPLHRASRCTAPRLLRTTRGHKAAHPSQHTVYTREQGAQTYAQKEIPRTKNTTLIKIKLKIKLNKKIKKTHGK
jgi:hypothetical protein